MQRSGNNLVINYTANDSVTVVGYFLGNSSIKKIIDSTGTQNISDLTFEAVKAGEKNTANAYSVNSKTGAITLTGSILNENLNGGNADDTIKATAGNNTITGGKGNDKLYAGTGVDTFNFVSGDGQDIIYNANSDDIIDLTTNVTDAANLKLSKDGNNLVIISSDLADTDKITVSI